MKKKALFGALAMSAVLATSANAAWKPGTAYYATESETNDLLEKAVDYAYCDGIARFGKSGEWPDESYHIFDCTIKRNGLYCTDYRLRTIKATRYGYFKIAIVKSGDCY